MTATAPAAPAKVYFTNLRTHARESQLDKLKRLIRHAGIEQIDFENKFVAIKIHFGELGNLSFLRPNYARAVADVVKELGGKPFLTDCNTLYVGSRKNALEHIDTAYQNGFTPYATGCQIIIADGLKGTDEALVPVEGGEYVHEAKIGQALMDADIVISLTHFKGHEQAGFGGTMKNLGMGGGSRAGKMEQHAAGKPNVATEHCVGCRACEKVCAHSAISFDDTRERELANGNTRTVHVAAIDHDRCVGCGRCIGVCNQDAIKPGYDAAADVLNCKIAEYTKPSSTAARASTFRSPWTLAPTATAIPKTTRPSSTISACSRASTRSPSTRPAPTPSWHPSCCPTPSSPIARPRWSTTTSIWRRSGQGPLLHHASRHRLAHLHRARREDRPGHEQVRAHRGQIAPIYWTKQAPL